MRVEVGFERDRTKYQRWYLPAGSPLELLFESLCGSSDIKAVCVVLDNAYEPILQCCWHCSSRKAADIT